MSICRRLPFQYCLRFALGPVVVGICLCGVSSADQSVTKPAEAQRPPNQLQPVSQARPLASTQVAAPDLRTESTGKIELVPPGNSTLQIRVARRPWLLEKLSGKKTTPSQKMNPPRPPADFPDPPSMSRLFPEIHADIPRNFVRDTQKSEASSQAALGMKPKQAADKKDATAGTRAADTKSGLPSDSQDRPVHADDTVVSDEQKQGELAADAGQPTPLRDRATSSQNAANQKQQETEEFDLVTELSKHADQVIAGEVAPPTIQSNDTLDEKRIQTNIAATESGPESEPESEERESSEEQVSVRELKIEPDGTAIDPSTGEVARKPKINTSNQPTAPDESKEPSQYVGDLQNPDDLEEPVTELPKQELDYTGHPRQPIRLTRSSLRMKGMMQQCLRYYYNRPEIANERSNWGMMHAIMVYGIDTKVIVGRQRYSAIAWIAGNNACRGQKLLTDEAGSIVAKSGVGLQGHQAQLLAVLSLAGVPQDYKLYAGNSPYTVQDLIDAEKLACKKGEELTFTLIALSHYLNTDVQWRNSDGEVWNFEKLIREELTQPIVGAACGGTHRLMGFAHALRARRAEGLPITGQWERADKYVQNFVQYTHRLQNRDGSMSTDWFEGREDTGELDRKVQTTGHMVEWLLTVTPDSQLQNRRLVSAIRFLLNSMYEERNNEWEIGPKGHALRSLAMYYERVYQSGPAWQNRSMARTRNARRR